MMATTGSLSASLPPLDLARLQQRLATCHIGHTIDYHTAISSTMPRAHELAQDPSFRAGGLVVAEEQTAGRGRQTRRWDAPPRTAVLISVILKPPLIALPPTHAPMLAAVAVYDAVAAAAPELTSRLGLKWPNDLLIGARKVAGLLAESRLQADGSLGYVILGIGINANQSAFQLPQPAAGGLTPTSVSIERGTPVDRTDLLARLCEGLAAWLTNSNASLLHLTWKRRLVTLGRRVAVYATADAQTPTWLGTAVDVDTTGALIVADDRGERRTFAAGDVTLRPSA